MMAARLVAADAPERINVTNAMSRSEQGDREPQLLSWKQFSDADIFHSVDSLHSFYLSVQFPQFKSWNAVSDMTAIQDVLYEATYELLNRSGLHRYDSLARGAGDSAVGVTYRDADNEFSVEFTQTSE